MNEVKWTDSQLRIAYEDGCKYQNFDDLVEHLQDMDKLSDNWQTTKKTTSESVLPIPCVSNNEERVAVDCLTCESFACLSDEHPCRSCVGFNRYKKQ